MSPGLRRYDRRAATEREVSESGGIESGGGGKLSIESGGIGRTKARRTLALAIGIATLSSASALTTPLMDPNESWLPESDSTM